MKTAQSWVYLVKVQHTTYALCCANLIYLLSWNLSDFRNMFCTNCAVPRQVKGCI